MIEIHISKPIKCNSEKAIFVSFPYDINIINLIRSFPVRYWHPDIKMWEMPHSFIDRLQDVLNAENYVITNDFQNSKFYHPDEYISNESKESEDFMNFVKDSCFLSPCRVLFLKKHILFIHKVVKDLPLFAF